jgi:hypothetical protein
MNQLFKLKNNHLTPLDSVPFKLEKEIQNIIEGNTEELFGLKMVKSEFTVGDFRLDSLCFDEETKSFVIIEYKRDKSYSVIDQGYSYLSTMLNNKSDFVLEFNENLEDTLKRDQVDWSQSRIIFVSTSFSSYQKTSINFKDVPFELWEISRFSNDTVSLNQMSSTSKESIKSVGKVKGTVIKNVSEEIEVYDEDSNLNNVTNEVKDLYFELKERVSNWEDVGFRYKRNYISILNKNKVKIYLKVQKNQIKIHLIRRIDFKGDVTSQKVKFNIKDPDNLFELKKSSHKEQYEYFLKNEKDLDYLVMLLKQKYES